MTSFPFLRHNAVAPRQPRRRKCRALARASVSVALAGAILLGGCQSPGKWSKGDKAVRDYFDGNYEGAVTRLEPLSKKTDQNYVLNNLRLGSSALAAYDLTDAEQAFLRAWEVINAGGVNSPGRAIAATWLDEKIKIWKGEPYERAMASFYLGLIYYMRGDYDNARAGFENALFKLRDNRGGDRPVRGVRSYSADRYDDGSGAAGGGGINGRGINGRGDGGPSYDRNSDREDDATRWRRQRIDDDRDANGSNRDEGDRDQSSDYGNNENSGKGVKGGNKPKNANGDKPSDPDQDDRYARQESTFTLALVMLGRTYQRLGQEDLARANFARARQLNPGIGAMGDDDLQRQSNVLIVVDFGYGPKKVTDFDGSIVGFSPDPQQAGPIPEPVVRVDGRRTGDRDLARPLIDTVAMAQERRWQSIDTVRTVKSGIGTGLIAGAAGYGLYRAGRDDFRGEDVALVGGLLAAGLLLKATSQADTRHWEMLPRTTFLLPLRLSPGLHDVSIDFPGGPVGITQELRGIRVPDAGEATYYVRINRFNRAPLNFGPVNPLDTLVDTAGPSR